MVILKSLSDGLERLAGDGFAPVFNNSRNQGDYRWGMLHRIVLAHPLGSVFSVPSVGGPVEPPLGGALPGFPIDGAFETLDKAETAVRASSWNGFMLTKGAPGPALRNIYELGAPRIRGESSLPGGISGDVLSPLYTNLLTRWLNNEYFPLLQRQDDLERETMSVQVFVPGTPRGTR